MQFDCFQHPLCCILVTVFSSSYIVSLPPLDAVSAQLKVSVQFNCIQQPLCCVLTSPGCGQCTAKGFCAFDCLQHPLCCILVTVFSSSYIVSWPHLDAVGAQLKVSVQFNCIQHLLCCVLTSPECRWCTAKGSCAIWLFFSNLCCVLTSAWCSQCIAKGFSAFWQSSAAVSWLDLDVISAQLNVSVQINCI